MSKYTDKELQSPVSETEAELIGSLWDNWDDFNKVPEDALEARQSSYMEFRRAVFDLKKHWIDEYEATQAADDKYNSQRGWVDDD